MSARRDFITKNFGKMTGLEMAKALGCGKSRIYDEASRMGLSFRTLSDLTGRTFHGLQVASRARKTIHSKSYWNCVCGCGKETVVEHSRLVRGETKSCGCLARKKSAENFRKYNDVKARRFRRVSKNAAPHVLPIDDALEMLGAGE